MVLIRYAGRCYAGDKSPCEQGHPIQTWQTALVALVVLCQMAALAWFHPQRPLARLTRALSRKPGSAHGLEASTRNGHAESGTCNCTCDHPNCRTPDAETAARDERLNDDGGDDGGDDDDDDGWETDNEDADEAAPYLANIPVATGTLRYAAGADNFAQQREYAVWIERETENALWIEKVDDERYRRVLSVLGRQNAWGGMAEVTEEWDQPIVR